MKKIVAKFQCSGQQENKDHNNLKSSESIYLNAVYSDDPKHENYKWSKATPAGTLSLHISNPGAFNFFETFGEYKITIEKIEKNGN